MKNTRNLRFDLFVVVSDAESSARALNGSTVSAQARSDNVQIVLWKYAMLFLELAAILDNITFMNVTKVCDARELLQ